jgi:hypothetical protein
MQRRIVIELHNLMNVFEKRIELALVNLKEFILIGMEEVLKLFNFCVKQAEFCLHHVTFPFKILDDLG